MKKYLILMAAGSGTRMNKNTPKQFIEVSGIPIIAHTYKQFKNITNLKTIIVLPENKFEYWKNYISNILKEENRNIGNYKYLSKFSIAKIEEAL